MARLLFAPFATLLFMLTATAAGAATLNCAGDLVGQTFSISGDLGEKAQTFSFVQYQYGSLVNVTSTPATDVHPSCGDARSVLSESLSSFEVTEKGIWGEFLLQLPIASLQERSPFTANLHACWFDGDWSQVNDVPVQCTWKSEEN
jgi:hypothetical protein